MPNDNEHRKAVGECVGLLAGSYRIEVDALLLEAYRIGLDGLTPQQIRAATAKVLQSGGEFMPRPGQLRQFGLTGGVSFEARADVAWHEFDRAVASHGGDHSVSFADGLINATVNLLGGWILCCDKSGDDYFVWLQKSFQETYVRLCQSPNVSDELRRPLVGRYQLQNAGFPDRVLNQLAAYTGEPVEIKTSQPVLLPPVSAPKRIERAATDGPKRLGEVLRLSNGDS
jgi:Domain of unknown function (DUF6475)